jgi:predicted RNA-binding protein YlqC (UPF0109 family)
MAEAKVDNDSVKNLESQVRLLIDSADAGCLIGKSGSIIQVI